jgi:hypothetical protein
MSIGAATIVHPGVGYEQRVQEDLPVVLNWLRRYVSQPSSQLGRRGPVCPFVPPALDADAVRFSFHYEIDRDPNRIRAVLRDELLQFRDTAEPPASSGTSLASLLVVLPNTDPAGWAAIDQAYGDLKDVAVEHGLMIGQFHPKCMTSAVRNPSLLVSRSPIPLVAIRHMAPHDILFLHQRREWFDAYRKRFTGHVSRGRVRDPLLRQLYDAALRRYGPDHRSGCPVDNPAERPGTPGRHPGARSAHPAVSQHRSPHSIESVRGTRLDGSRSRPR